MMQHYVIDVVALFDFIVKLAAGIVTLSAAAAIIIPKSRNWIIKKITAGEETEKRVQRLSSVETDVKKMEETMSVLLHDRFFQSCLYNLKRGYTTNVDLENINHLYEQYRDYGNNGYGKALYDKVQELEVRVNEYL